MIAELKTGNQIFVPRELIEKFPEAHFFDAEVKDGALVLKPLTEDMTLSGIRGKMRQLGLTAQSVPDAVAWARSRR